jgi:hypothetical protein
VRENNQASGGVSVDAPVSGQAAPDSSRRPECRCVED